MTTWKVPLTLSLVLFVVFALYFRAIILSPAINSDLNAHIGFAKDAYEGNGVWPRHILFFALVTSTSFWSASLTAWQTSAWLWLSLLQVLKFLATVWFGYLWLGMFGQPQSRPRANTFQTETAVTMIALCLAVVFCFPQPDALHKNLWYAYSFPPNTWHNSTQIAVMPLAILVFGLSVRQLTQPNNLTRALAIAVLAVLSALAKPSFLMAWLPAYGICTLFLWQRHRSARTFLITAAPAVFATAIILSQYYLIYTKSINNTSISIGYLETWTSSAERSELQFYISVIFSSLFPILFYITHVKRMTEPAHALSILMVIISYIYAIFLSESGSVTSGNLMWPIISANFISYTICIFDIYATHDKRTQKNYTTSFFRIHIPVAVFLLNSIFGIAFIIRYVQTGDYH